MNFKTFIKKYNWYYTINNKFSGIAVKLFRFKSQNWKKKELKEKMVNKYIILHLNYFVYCGIIFSVRQTELDAGLRL